MRMDGNASQVLREKETQRKIEEAERARKPKESKKNRMKVTYTL